MNNAHAHDDSSDSLHVLDILNEMRRLELETSFIFSLMENCHHYEGLKDLMEMWFEESDFIERDIIVADIQDMLDEIKSTQVFEEHTFLKYDDLEAIKQDVSEFKNRLREEVDKQGGISELSRRTGIPQPSLSRFFSSNSIPRRTTLFKIAKALNIPESTVGFKWSQ